MRNFVRKTVSALAVAVAMSASGAQAGVVDSADVIIGGTPYRTFVDQTTGKTWLDLDNFWTPTATYNSVVAALAGSGFHIATLADLTLLQASIPAVPANFDGEVDIVGGNYVGKPGFGNRDLIWGVYDDGNSADGVSYAWKYGYNTLWNISLDVVFATILLRDQSSPDRDLGVWAVSDTSGETPLPAALPLFGSVLGLGAWLGARRRKKAVA